jgi:hypothetical protein
VLLVVVLSMLVLFMLIGTAFVMVSGEQRDAAKASARANRLVTPPTDVLDRALMTVLRDTEDPNSTISSHSILRDLYGTDGFQAQIYKFNPAKLGPPPVNADPVDLLASGLSSMYAGATLAAPLGPTQGQFIDLYVKQLAFGTTTSLNDTHTQFNEATLTAPDLRHVLKLDRNLLSQPQIHVLPLTRGYYNGCLLTITNGPAAGQSTRIVDYECVNPVLTGTTTTPITRLFRFRVMAFSRSDGNTLRIGTEQNPPQRVPELTELAGASFIVNGRPFNGTGVGYNKLAQTGQARLTALEYAPVGSGGHGLEIALTPNARYLNFRRLVALNPNPTLPILPDQFLQGGIVGYSSDPTPPEYLWLNDPAAALLNWPYASFSGPGDADESYDAADFQNLWLALQTVTPRARGQVVTDADPKPISPDEFLFNPPGLFLRLDLEDLPLPSFHRPDLVNFWFHRLTKLAASGAGPDEAVTAVIHPYGPDGIRDGMPGDTNDNPTAVDLPTRDFIVNIKRKFIMRPLREDHPNFDGSNHDSIPPQLVGKTSLFNGVDILIPYWEAVGPWDVDNDNDGVPDSIWVDLGDPVQQLEDGTRVKALYAYLIIDLDSRLNVNAHGLVDHIDPFNYSPLSRVTYASDPANLVVGPNLAGGANSNVLAQGLGYGPAEISLRPVFPAPLNPSFIWNRGEDLNVEIDDFATLMFGRINLDGTTAKGKYGFILTMNDFFQATPGLNYLHTQTSFTLNPYTSEQATPDLAAQLKFFDYPLSLLQRSAFGTPPDLFGRYSMGLDYSGQPYYEVLNDTNPTGFTYTRALLTDSPYEIDLSGAKRRDDWDTKSDARFADSNQEFNASLVQNDDAPFATADLERVLRAWDLEAGSIPSRLWDVVDAFDPLKLMQYENPRTAQTALNIFGFTTEPEMLAAAQLTAGVNRRLVTTDSYDLPVPGGSIPNQGVFALGPDGFAGRAGFDDDGDDPSNPDEPDELNALVTDDFKTLFGKEVATASIFDLLRFYAWKDMRRKFMAANGLDESALAALPVTPDYATFLTAVSNLTEARLSGETYADTNGNGRIDAAELLDVPGLSTPASNGVYDQGITSLLAPEVIAGKRMDLNRPFGDGRDNGGDGFDNDGNGYVDEGTPGDPDNNGNGVVDDPMEAGDPFLDINGNGKWDAEVAPNLAEPFINLDGSDDGMGNPTYSPPRDQLWQNITAEPIAFDYTNGHAEPVHKAVADAILAPANNYQQHVVGGVRNLESQGRQLYARQLYCMMLLLVDEGYIAPHDENDPQIKGMLNASDTKSQAGIIKAYLDTLPPTVPPMNTAQEARRIVLRKLTLRAIAQWAVNCVDARDADAIMTPFEYDENPWDGWGTRDSDGNLIPLDGDIGTDENGDLTANTTNVIDWVATAANDGVKTLQTVKAPANALEQTRAFVIGAERPELLITETLALHDRRTEDLAVDYTKETMEHPTNPPKDDDLDQRLRPRGSLFVEVYNPWSPTGQYPAEIYSLFNSRYTSIQNKFIDRNHDTNFDANDIMGVELGQMSTMGAFEITAPTLTTPGAHKLTAAAAPTGSTNIKRSPVWRMVVVEENPQWRQSPSDDLKDNNADPLGTQIHTGSPDSKYTGTGKYFEPADPDRPSRQFYSQEKPSSALPLNEPYIERQIYFTSDNSVRLKRNDLDDPSGANENFLNVNRKKIRDRLRLPPQFGQSAQYFIAADVTKLNDPNKFGDVPIAPIKPGRYAVIGTAGAQYKSLQLRTMEETEDPTNGNNPYQNPRYVSTVSRRFVTNNYETQDIDHIDRLESTRRIELFPCDNPDVQQILVGANGGTPLFPRDPALPVALARRDNEVLRTAETTPKFRNIYDGSPDDDPATVPAGQQYKIEPDTELIPACVAIPIKDMSVSEPIDLYVSRRALLDEEEKTASLTNPNLSLQSHYYNPEAAEGEGCFVGNLVGTGNETAYDTPFDLAPELRRNGTTRNYRTIHLQRLADPTLPWNPLPTLPDGKKNNDHDPRLPVNLYRTIDTASVDLTAFNGASSREPVNTIEAQAEARWLPEQLTQFAPMYSAGGEHRLHMRSLERGFKAVDNIAPNGATPIQLQVGPRTLWRQEPINLLADMHTWQDIPPTTANQTRTSKLIRRAGDLRLRDKETVENDITAIAANVDVDGGSGDGDPAYAGGNFPTSLKPPNSHFNILLDHSLGFGNESLGATVSWNDVVDPAKNLPTATNGNPAPDDAEKFTRLTPGPDIAPTNTSSFPWLAWNNRPFVSAEELLNVPAASSSQMLRNYSTIFRTTHNPYDGTGIDSKGTPNPADDTPLTVGQRLAAYLSPFGHLLGFSQTAARPAETLKNDPTTGAPLPEWIFLGAPHFYRILEFVHVPSRYVGTDTMLTAETFNDIGNMADTYGFDIANGQDPRFRFQPPFNKVSRERDPGQVNLNTVTGRRLPPSPNDPPRLWSEVFDGIMHRQTILDTAKNRTYGDANPANQVSHLGPAWRDVVISRKGYAQFNADGTGPVEKAGPIANPDVFQFGLNSGFPSVFSNPFRSPDAGDFVPLQSMVQTGVQASWMRSHHFGPGPDGAWGMKRQTPDIVGSDDDELRALTDPLRVVDDAREAGFGDDVLISNSQSFIPLFSERTDAATIDGNRNPYFYYQPMTRISNLVTNRSNVFAIWITVGYFEVSPAPNWNDPDDDIREAIRSRFGSDLVDNSAADQAAKALYNRVYPDGYQLGREVGSDTGNVRRPRGFYIVDRTEEVGFKPGEDLNVEKMIRLRRRIE